VMDTVLGNLSDSFADSLAAGDSESHEFDYVVLESDPDPLLNEVTATGSGVGSRVVVDDLAACATDLIHPAIEIVKTVDEDTVPIGTTVTYTYLVTNTGDTTLYDISVDDDILGHIGDIAVLEPGESATLTRDFVVGDVPVTNVGTATGEDILGRSVSADDDAIVTPIAGEGPPPENPPTPFTGSDAGRLGIVSMVLFGIGVTVVATTRRRRPEREAA
jgi:ethanolamine utilization microcompartment shell protein EutS